MKFNKHFLLFKNNLTNLMYYILKRNIYTPKKNEKEHTVKKIEC